MKGYTTETASDGLQNHFRVYENIVTNIPHKKRTFVYVVVSQIHKSNRRVFNLYLIHF